MLNLSKLKEIASEEKKIVCTSTVQIWRKLHKAAGNNYVGKNPFVHLISILCPIKVGITGQSISLSPNNWKNCVLPKGRMLGCPDVCNSR